MSVSHICDVPRDTGYFNVCHICGIPLDANNFDVADIKKAPTTTDPERELVRFALHPQYCGALLYFAQHADPETPQDREIFKTPGYEWVILCNEQPRDPYLPTDVIRNPWGENAFPVQLRLEEGCVVRFVVRKVPAPADETEITLSQVGGRLVGRYWYNTIYGGAPNRL